MSDMYSRFFLFPDILIMLVLLIGISGYIIAQPFSWSMLLFFCIGLIVMLLVYEWKHYVAHVPLKPRTHFGKWMKKTHLLHHFKNEHYWFGVSNPVGDWLFGTLKDEKTVLSSQTVRDLEKELDNKKPPIH